MGNPVRKIQMQSLCESIYYKICRDFSSGIFVSVHCRSQVEKLAENEKSSAEMRKCMEQFVEEKRRYERIGDCLVFYLTEDLDHHAADKFRELSDYLIEREQVKNIIFDFTGVSFMDSSGIGMLMGRYKKVMFLGGRAAVTGVGDVVDRIFLLSGVYKIIEKYDTTEEALAEIKRGKEMEEA